MFCPYCGIRLGEETNNFCPHCGKRLPQAHEPFFPAPQPFIDPDDSAAMEAVVKTGVLEGAPRVAEGATALLPGSLPTPIPPVAPTMAMPAVVPAPQPIPVGRRVPARGSTVAAIVIACLLLIGALAIVWLAPVVSAPFVAEPSGPLMSAVAQVEPALAVSIADGSTVWRGTLVGLVGTGIGYANALGAATQATSVEILVGAGCGLVVVATLFVLVGSLTSLVQRRPTGLLVAAALLTFVVLLAATVAICVVDVLFTADLRAAATALFAGSGPRVTIPAHGLLPTPFLLGALGMALIAVILVTVARHGRGTEHPYVS